MPHTGCLDLAHKVEEGGFPGTTAVLTLQLSIPICAMGLAGRHSPRMPPTGPSLCLRPGRPRTPRLDEDPGASQNLDGSSKARGLAGWERYVCPSLPGLASRCKNLLRAVGHMREADPPTPGSLLGQRLPSGDISGGDTKGVPGIEGLGQGCCRSPHMPRTPPTPPPNDQAPNGHTADGEKVWPGSKVSPACCRAWL